MSENTKKEYLDFVLYDDEHSKIIFRFLPRESTCHSFNHEPPKEWSDVYKVYYSYTVIRQYKNKDKTEILFKSHCDECSIIDEVAFRIRLLGRGETHYENTLPDDSKQIIPILNDEMFPYGYGVTWILRHYVDDSYEVDIFDHDDVGYRFIIPKDKLIKFGEYLHDCSEYMLAHGDPI